MSPAGQAIGFRTRLALTVVALIVLIVTANIVAKEIASALDFEIRPSNEDMVHRALMTLSVVYSLLIAIPFVPGIEIGLAMLAMLGPAIVVLVYLCTIAGLSLSFLVGRLVPLDTLGRLFAELHMQRAGELMRRLEPLDYEARLKLLVQNSPSRVVPALVRHRYIGLAGALNLPGNFLIGGGGGIALIAGVSKLYSITGFLLTTAIAVAPVPLAVYLFGTGFLFG